MIKNETAESEVHVLLENLEIAAACSGCGCLSLSVLRGGGCPHCEHDDVMAEG